MTIKYYYDLTQHTDQWEKARAGIITASVMKNLMKKKTDRKTGEVTYEAPDNDATKAYLFELAAQRINDFLEPNYQSYAMQRGVIDEVDVFNIYSEKYHKLKTCGFVTNEEYGFVFGYSPDGLTALTDDGQIEAKSRGAKFQAETIFYNEVPEEYIIQIQTGLIVTKRKWCDFVSYCGGMPMFVKRVLPDHDLQQKIIASAQWAEIQIRDIAAKINMNIHEYRFTPTVRRVEEITA